MSHRKIYKYTLGPESEVELPMQAEILCVHEQGEDICLWALVNPQNEVEKRTFLSFGTGHKVSDLPLRYVGTSFLEGGLLVFHTFELLKEAQA